MMETRLIAISICFWLGMQGAVHAGPIYDIDLAVGAGSIAGMIETDGTEGFLATENILSWAVTLDDGVDSFTFSDTDPGTFFVNELSLLSATATELFLDFSETSGGVVAFLFGSAVNDWAFAAIANGVTPGGNVTIAHSSLDPPLLHGESFDILGAQSLQFAVLRSGIPEPGTLLLLTAGLFGLWIAPRGRRKGTRRRTIQGDHGP